MRVNDIAQNHMDRQSAGIGGIQYGMNKRTNSDGLTGMCINGMTSSDFKSVNVSSKVTSEIKELAKSEFLTNFGKTDGEALSVLSKKYIAHVPEQERINVGWTLGNIFRDESQKLNDIVKEQYPNWQEGQVFNRNEVEKLISNHFDQKA